VQYSTCTFLVNCNRDYDLGSVVRESTAAADVAALRCSSATSVRPHSTLLRLCTYCRFMLLFCTCCHFMVQSKLFVHEDTRISERVYKCCSAILWFNPVPSYGSRHNCDLKHILAGYKANLGRARMTRSWESVDEPRESQVGRDGMSPAE
jgi:hypothetical protein